MCVCVGFFLFFFHWKRIFEGCYCLFMCVFALSLHIQLSREKVVITLICLNPPNMCAYPKLGPEFTTKYVVISVGGVEWFDVRGRCWYWWNCWPSLIKLLFRNIIYSIIYISLHKTTMNIGWLIVKHTQNQIKLKIVYMY